MLLLLRSLLDTADQPPVIEPPGQDMPRAAIASGGGPDAALSVAEYLKKFGSAGLPPTARNSATTNARRRRELEIVLLS